MKIKVFTVLDVKAEKHLPPMFFETKAVAIRQVAEAANNPEHNFCKYPADYVLFEIGEYDDTTGELLPANAKMPLGTMIEFKMPAKDEQAATIHEINKELD